MSVTETEPETDKHARVKLMKNMNKPLPDGVALPTSETGQRGRVGI